MRLMVRSNKNNGRRFQRAVIGGLLCALGLTSCGGGDQKETFRAQRVISFGDENSLINSDGRKYTINALKVDGVTPECAANLLWNQVVAANYGLVFSECRGNLVSSSSRIYATFHAKVADIQGQIDLFNTANPALSSTDLVTLMVGHQDLMEVYQEWMDWKLANPSPSVASIDGKRSELAAQAQAKGYQLGLFVVDLTRQTKAKVLISTLPDLAKTPYGVAQASDIDRVILNAISTSFNNYLGSALDTDPNGGGRSGALLDAEYAIVDFVRDENNQFDFDNQTQAACLSGGLAMADADLATNCSTATAAVGSAKWLWAGRTQVSAQGHSRLGERAVQRLRNNPL